MSYAPLTLYPAIDGDDGQAGRVLGATSHDRSTWQRVVRRTNSIHGACEAVAGNIGLSIAKPQLASTRQNVWADLRRGPAPVRRSTRFTCCCPLSPTRSLRCSLVRPALATPINGLSKRPCFYHVIGAEKILRWARSSIAPNRISLAEGCASGPERSVVPHFSARI
jgi:hypothetical protein